MVCCACEPAEELATLVQPHRLLVERETHQRVSAFFCFLQHAVAATAAAPYLHQRVPVCTLRFIRALLYKALRQGEQLVCTQTTGKRWAN